MSSASVMTSTTTSSNSNDNIVRLFQNTSMRNDEELEDEDDDDSYFYSAQALEADASLRAPTIIQQGSPICHGPVMKLHYGIFFHLLPRQMQRFVARRPLLGKWCALCQPPTWKRRYLILCGSYLYKFIDPTNHRLGPKGTPIPVESVEVKLVPIGDAIGLGTPVSQQSSTEIVSHNNNNNSFQGDDFMAMALSQTLPPGWTCVFTVSTLHKKHYYACPDYPTAQVWVNSLREAQHESVKREMGHAPKFSYPKAWDYFDQKARELVRSREKRSIQRKLLEKGGSSSTSTHPEEAAREMEMKVFSTATATGSIV